MRVRAGSYFHVGYVAETWSTGWQVTAARLPLGLMVQEFATAGFVVEPLVEPRPLPEMARTHPATFAKLSTVPNFVLFKLRRP